MYSNDKHKAKVWLHLAAGNIEHMSTTGAKYVLANNGGQQGLVLFDSERAKKLLHRIVKGNGGDLVTQGSATVIRFPKDEAEEAKLRNRSLAQFSQSFFLPVIQRFLPTVNTASYFSYNELVRTPALQMSSQNVKFKLSDIADSSSHLAEQFIYIETDVPVADSVPVIPGALSPRYRYCAFPGIRLIRNIAILINEAVVSTYTAEHVIWFMQNRLPAAARAAFFECMGQDVGIDSKYYHTDQQFDETLHIFRGYQTFREDQPGLKLAIPLIFFYNLVESALQITNVDIQGIQIQLEFESVDKIVQGIIPYAESDVNGENVPLPITKLGIKKCAIYSHKVFFDGFLQEIFQNRNHFRSFRDYGIQKTTLVGGESSVQITMKHAVESFAVAIQSLATSLSFDDWWIFAYIDKQCFYAPIVFNNIGDFDGLGARPFEAKYYIPYFENEWVSTSSEDINSTEQLPRLTRRFETYAWARNSCCDFNTSDRPTISEFSWALTPGRCQTSGSVSFSRNQDIQYHWTPNPLCPEQASPSTPLILTMMTQHFNVLNNQNGAIVRTFTA